MDTLAVALESMVDRLAVALENTVESTGNTGSIGLALICHIAHTDNVVHHDSQDLPRQILHGAKLLKSWGLLFGS